MSSKTIDYEKIVIFSIVLVFGAYLGFVITICIISFDIGHFQENNGLMYQKYCNNQKDLRFHNGDVKIYMRIGEICINSNQTNFKEMYCYNSNPNIVCEVNLINKTMIIP